MGDPGWSFDEVLPFFRRLEADAAFRTDHNRNLSQATSFAMFSLRNRMVALVSGVRDLPVVEEDHGTLRSF